MKFLAIVICVILPFAVIAQDRDFTLSAPAEIVETGFLKYLVPRFSLKHSVRVIPTCDKPDSRLGIPFSSDF